MNKLQFMNSISRMFHKAGFKLKKHSPEILVTAGVVGVVTSAIMGCKATTKVNDILSKTKEDVDKIHSCVGNENLSEEYTEEDAKKDLTIVYTQTGLKLVKLYAPSVILGALSITSILTSHNIIRRRNVALAAAYATVDNSFKEYRGRVVDRFGEDLDRELRYNIKAKEIEETVVDENGEEKTVKKTVNSIDISNTPSDYARVFYEGNPGWTKSAEKNMLFLKLQQSYANKKLQSQGYLFLNDVYEMLGFNKTTAGHTVGWIYDPKDKNRHNFVDFGIYNNVTDERKAAFINGDERSVLLDFNVDGPILNDVKF